MSDPKAQAEPSMEEILASIRRIISEDGPEAGSEPPAGGPAPDALGLSPLSAGLDEPDGDVLELTETVDDMDQPSPPAPPPYRAVPEPPPRPPALDPPVPPPTWQKEAPMAPSGRDDDRLLSPAAEALAEGALSRLMRDDPSPPSSPDPLPLGEDRTVEQIVRELLKPVLRDWLDRNLPAIVERVVQEQVERLARNVQRR